MSRRVVVTGMGAITPIGLSVAEFWQEEKKKKNGFAEITHFDASDYKCKLAAEVKGFDAKNYMDPKTAKRMELFSQYAIAATKEAIEDAGLDMEKEDAFRVGTSIGSGVGSMQTMEREHQRLLEKGPGRVGPMTIPMMIGNMAAGNVSIQYGEAEVMIAGGTEGSICPIGIAGFTALTALSTETDPKKCSIPFDKNRSGFVMGEGAAVVVLEELEHAKARGAKFKQKVMPGDVLTLETEIIKRKGPIGVGKAAAKVGEKVVCMAELTFAIG